MTTQDAWFLVAVAGVLAGIAIVWSVLLARGALRGRRLVLEAMKALTGGDLSRRLDEDQAGERVAAAFNQAARDLDERESAAGRTLDRLRRLGGGLQQQVVLDLDADAEVREVLGDLEAVTGHRPGTVLGRHAAFFLASEGEWENLHRLAAEDPGGEARLLLPVRRLGGELELGEVSLCRGADGAFRMVLSRRLPDADLEQRAVLAEERLAALLGGIGDAILLLVDGRIASANPRFLSLLKTTAEVLHGQPLTAMVVAGDLMRALGLLAATGGSDDGEVEITMQAPGSEPVGLAVTAGQAQSGGVSFQILLARPIGEGRALERRLGLYGAWLAAALEASREGLAVLARRPGPGPWPVALSNSAFNRMLGLPEGRLPRAQELADALDSRLADASLAAAFLRGFDLHPETAGKGTFETSDEPPRTLEMVSSPVLDASGSPVGRLLALRDVTEVLQMEEDLRREAETLSSSLAELQRVGDESQRAHQELTLQVARLEEANHELKEVDEMKTNLLGNVSHELQTPLVSIKGYTEMMVRGDLGPVSAEQRQGLEVSLRNIKRLISLIDQLLAFARTEEKLTELTLEEFPLWQLLDETINLLGDRVKTQDLKVTTRYDTDDLTVMADRNLIGQVLINLLGNAIKYNRKGGEVAVSVRGSSAGELVVEIRDTGVGVPRDEQERIFERGYRASTSGGTRGSGIGLALVREILKRHGCQIRVDSRQGEGSTFAITLPLAPRGPGGRDSEAAPAAPSRQREDGPDAG